MIMFRNKDLLLFGICWFEEKLLKCDECEPEDCLREFKLFPLWLVLVDESPLEVDIAELR